ncbi:hypothetical protein A0J48_007000 [Sphaerospermopsis aphanizomenoides BCCUSP55]|uniref:hypothetical protein n=1 Tax=Sphaerospermopsis aphanizomenoides TaxID=459663 RepID=UPI001904696A|nr:hypothetical protein [Sphaerospermopsis aphanizomenoides]MBK1987284.1 hypothetical protein [Sphaerospermopsis aphanizomenoides BCCUSP55]
MGLPQNYKKWQHLMDMIKRDQNKLLQKYFKDLGPNWEPEITTNRGAIRTACTIQDDDSAVIVIIRLFYFYIVLGYAFRGLAPVFGIPSRQFQESYELHPQIFLYFSQDRASVPDGLRPVEATISFRVKAYTKENMTPDKATPFANRIFSEFVDSNKGIVFTKGKEITTYVDVEHGLKCLQIFAMNQAEGVDVIKKILAVLLLPYDEKAVGLSDKPKKASITKPIGTEMVYGKAVPKKRWRPIAKVRFRYAYMVLDNREYPIMLVDTTGRYWDAIKKTS